MTMQLAVDGGRPDYDSAFADDDELVPAIGDVDAEPEVRAPDWAPRDPTQPAAREVLFVDGVERRDAQIWGTDASGTHQAVAVSYAAGIARCDGAASVEDCLVRRGLFGPSAFASAGTLGTGPRTYEHKPTAGTGREALAKAVRERRDLLEVEVAMRAAPADLLIVDGPLRGRQGIARAVGYVKSHHASYLPPELDQVVAGLGTGQRTPLFLVQSTWSRFSWYLRLPYGTGHPWAGVVRCDASADLPLAEVVALADTVTATLPRFASQPHKDPRAPQNLYPIGGLERHLKRLLGDAGHLHRSLLTAVAAR